MKKNGEKKKSRAPGNAALNALIEEIIVDAYGDHEQLWAFRQALEDNIDVPAPGHIAGEPVSVLAFDFDGNERRGLIAKVRGSDGRRHVIAAADLVMTENSVGARYLAAYRKWMGLPPYPATRAAPRVKAPRQLPKRLSRRPDL